MYHLLEKFLRFAESSLGGGGSALWLKDVVFKTRWIKNSKSFLSVPPLPPHALAAPQLPNFSKNNNRRILAKIFNK